MRYCHSLTFSITNFSIFPFLVSRSFCSKARANRYASLLQLCCLQSPISCSFACAVHAHMIASGFKPRGHILNRLINIYSKSSKLAYARHLFDEIPQPGIVARSTLISAYSAIGDLELAKKIFNGTPLPMRDTVFYSAMITAYSHNNDGHAAIELFRDMRRNYFSPDNVTFTSVIGALALVAENERHCQQMHCAVLKSGMGFVTSVLNALIYAYVKCASSPSVLSSSLMGAARKLFDEILERDELSCSTIITGYMKNDDLDAAREFFYGGGMCEEMVVAWNAMISGYMHRGLYKEALEMFRKMYLSGMRSDEYTYTSVISVCANASFFQLGKELHAYILKTEVNPSPDFSLPVNNALITLYWKCGRVDEAREIFNYMPMKERDTVFYNAMITAYSHNNDGHAAIELFRDMRRNDFSPDNFTFTNVIGALALVAENERHCQQMHCAVVKSGMGFVTSVLNALMYAYVKCASSPSVLSSSLMGAARKLFDEMLERDELSCSTIITGYMKNDDLDAAREFFYGGGMCEEMVVAWNAMISGYVHRGLYKEALEMFRKMYLSGMRSDEYTYTSIISVCADAGFFQLGKELQAYILKTEVNPSPDFSLPVNNALITLYWKCGRVGEALEIFNYMPMKNLVSWNAILSGYVNAGRINEAQSFFEEMPEKNVLTWAVMMSGLAQKGFAEEGLKLFNQMKILGFEPCDYTFAGAITSCAVLGTLEHGRQLHAQLIRFGFDSSLAAGNALITLYARCGVVEAAESMFLTMPCVDFVSWNAMIAALGQHGHGIQAIELFEEMLAEGILPNGISFLTVLSACSHAGLVEKGHHYFNSMYSVYGITPGEDHYARVIDLLCRAGKFSEAKSVMESMPWKPGAPIWKALLAGSRIHGNMDIGINAAERLFELNPEHGGTYLQLSNMYAEAGRWVDVAKVRKLMRDRGVKMEPGCSWLEVEI